MWYLILMLKVSNPYQPYTEIYTQRFFASEGECVRFGTKQIDHVNIIGTHCRPGIVIVIRTNPRSILAVNR